MKGVFYLPLSDVFEYVGESAGTKTFTHPDADKTKRIFDSLTEWTFVGGGRENEGGPIPCIIFIKTTFRDDEGNHDYNVRFFADIISADGHLFEFNGPNISYGDEDFRQVVFSITEDSFTINTQPSL